MKQNLLLDKVSKAALTLSGVFGFLTFMAIIIGKTDKVELSEVLAFLNSRNRADQLAGINCITDSITKRLLSDPESVFPKMPEDFSIALRYTDPVTGEQMMMNIGTEGEITGFAIEPISQVVAFTAIKLPFAGNANTHTLPSKTGELPLPLWIILIDESKTAEGHLTGYSVELSAPYIYAAESCSELLSQDNRHYLPGLKESH